MSRLVRTNHAGRRVPAVLGLALVTSSGLGALAVAAFGPPFADAEIAFLGGWLGLGLVGLLDDLSGGGPRGIGGHLRSLARGKPTTGILKLLAGLGAAVAVVIAAGGGAARLAAGVVVIAACVNVWNALDVVPGRCLKWAIVLLAAVLPALWGSAFAGQAAVVLAVALALLPVDLRERAMLGDAGSNPLGLAVGVGLFLALPTWGVVVAAVVALGLQAAAETVTISRLIDSVPPLRWFDRLGRRPAA